MGISFTIGQSPDSESSDRVRTGAKLALRRFIEELSRRAIDGTLSLDAVRGIAARFEAKDGELERITQNIAAMAIVHPALSSLGQERRRNYIGRVLVDQFADLLVSEQAAQETPGRFSRHVVPVFLYAVEDLLGETRCRTHRAALASLAQRQKQRAGAGSTQDHEAGLPGATADWEDFISDPAVRAATDDILVDLAGTFENFEGRKRWLIETIEKALAALVPIKQNARLEPFGDAEFCALIARLFRGLAAGLADASARSALLSRHGATPVNRVEALLERIAA